MSEYGVVEGWRTVKKSTCDDCLRYYRSVPMKPIKMLKRFKTYHCMCPNCGMNVGIRPKKKTDTVYCPLCGQAIDIG